MTMTSLGFVFPAIEVQRFWMNTSPGSVTVTTFQINGTNDGLAWIFRPGAAMTIDAVAFRTTAEATGGDVAVRIETVNLTNGRPSGTLAGGGSEVAVTTGTSATSYEVAGLNAALSANTDYAVRINWTSGDRTIALTQGVAHSLFPYTYTFDGTTHTKGLGDSCYLAIGTATNNYISIPGFIGPVTTSTVSMLDSGNPDEIGVVFSVPVPMQLTGVDLYIDPGAAPWSIKLYTSPTTAPALASNGGVNMQIDVDTDAMQANTGGFDRYLFPTTYNLVAGASYGITVRAGTNGTYTVGQSTVTDADFLKCIVGSNGFTRIERQNDTGTFTNTATGMITIFPLMSGADDGVSASSGLAIPTLGRIKG